MATRAKIMAARRLRKRETGAELAENGVRIIRFLNDEVLYEPGKVIEKIKMAIRS